jgi:hypothetical protein
MDLPAPTARIAPLAVNHAPSDDAHVYAGPSSSLPPDRLASLDSRWACMPKRDGVYCTVTTDRRGTISNLLYRSGQLVSLTDADGLRGQYIGAPDATLVGELEAQTEASIRARTTRGYALLHVFDVARMDGRSLHSQPFSQRYGMLHQWQAAIECYEPDAAQAEWWRRDVNGDAHDVTGRFCTPMRGALRRLPIVPLHRGTGAGRALWDAYVEREGGEGVVACRLDAPLGKRGGKKKCRAVQTLDALVVSVGPRAAVLSYAGRTFAVSAMCKAAQGMRRGMVAEVVANGWTEASSIPKHARIVRVRADKAA